MDFDEKEFEKIILTGKEKAEDFVKNPDGLEHFLLLREEKLKSIPKVGETLRDIPAMFSMIRAYFTKEYTAVPSKVIWALLGALVYLISPLDVIPDAVPVLGRLDDVAVIAAAWKYAGKETDAYRLWRSTK
jgi:uncharacterized membrane protein YkvA (DUF1232 family)